MQWPAAEHGGLVAVRGSGTQGPPIGVSMSMIKSQVFFLTQSWTILLLTTATDAYAVPRPFRQVPLCWHASRCPWHRRGRCLFSHRDAENDVKPLVTREVDENRAALKALGSFPQDCGFRDVANRPTLG